MFGVVLLRSALIWGRFARFRINLGSFCCVLHELGAVSLRSVLRRFGAHSLENELIL